MINVGNTARQLRESLGLTQQEMADSLGITNVHLSHIENSKSFPSQDLIDRFRDRFEVDLYILAWCSDKTNEERIPLSLRKPAAQLARAWERRLVNIVKSHRKSEI
jgi:transcriptional regulator with XRE-family HTH domain